MIKYSINKVKRAKQILLEEGIYKLIYKSLGYLKRRVKRRVKKYVQVRLRPIVRHYKYMAKFETPIFRKETNIIQINPSKIDHIFVTDWIGAKPYGTWVKGGDWDTNPDTESRVPIYTDRGKFNQICKLNKLYLYENTDHYKSYQEHFIRNKKWEETEFYQLLHQKPERNDSKYRPAAEINNRLAEDDKIFESICRNGYKSQIELRQGNWKTNSRREIGVGITRGGQIVFVKSDGCHRLAITKILNIPEIPVAVKLRHEKWQQIREEIKTANSVSDLKPETREYLGHPDVAAISTHLNKESLPNCIDSVESQYY